MLNPHPNGTVEYIADAALVADGNGMLTYVGSWEALVAQAGIPEIAVTTSDGMIVPPFLDAHIHIPQHPIRGKFTEGIPEICPEGRLLAGLNCNVFPVEAKAGDPDYAAHLIRSFQEDTLSKGVVGGAAYMTVHADAVEAALTNLSPLWSVGLVLMNQNCPDYLRTDEATFAEDVAALAEQFGRRFILTDRFAIAVNTPLRRQASELASRYGLRMQTHLDEQLSEKALVEKVLYPNYANYTDVYARDGLLTHDPILAHCIHLTDEEFRLLQQYSVSIAHCPTSNTLLGSGIMPLDQIRALALPYAICTDVGASPTTSILAEMAQFLKVHAGRSAYATPQEALFRSTLAPAQILGVDAEVGSFVVGKPLSYLEVRCNQVPVQDTNVDTVIMELLLDRQYTAVPSSLLQHALDRLELSGLEYGPALNALTEDVEATSRQLNAKVNRVTLKGKAVWESI